MGWKAPSLALCPIDDKKLAEEFERTAAKGFEGVGLRDAAITPLLILLLLNDIVEWLESI